MRTTPVQLQLLVLLASTTATLNIPGPGILVGLTLAGSAAANAASGGNAVAIFSLYINGQTGVNANGAQGTSILAALLIAVPTTLAGTTFNANANQHFPISRRVRTGDVITLAAGWTGIQPQLTGSALVTILPD